MLSVSLPPEPGLSGASTRMPQVVPSCVSGKGPFREAEAPTRRSLVRVVRGSGWKNVFPGDTGGHGQSPRAPYATGRTFGGTATPSGRADSPSYPFHPGFTCGLPLPLLPSPGLRVPLCYVYVFSPKLRIRFVGLFTRANPLPLSYALSPYMFLKCHFGEIIHMHTHAYVRAYTHTHVRGNQSL